jgi:hypothetical protein
MWKRSAETACPKVLRLQRLPPRTYLAGILRSEIHHVHVSAESNVVREIPPVVIRIQIDHYVVSIPEPIVNEVIIIRSYLEEEAVKPKPLPVSAV